MGTTEVRDGEPVVASGDESPRFVVSHGSPAENAADHWRAGLRYLGTGAALALGSYQLLLWRVWPA